MSSQAFPIYLPRRRRIVTPGEWLREKIEEQRREREATIALATGTHRGSHTNTTNNANPYTSSSGNFTTVANELLVMGVYWSSSTGVIGSSPTLVSSTGITFTLAKVQISSNTGFAVAIFVSDTLSDADSTLTFTADLVGTGSPSGIAMLLVGVSGMTLMGSPAIVQSASGLGTTTAPTFTFGSAVNTANITVIFAGDLVNPATLTQPGSWTELADIGYATPTSGLESAARSSGFTGTTVTWASTPTGRWVAGGVELDVSGPTGGPAFRRPRARLRMRGRR